MPRYRFSNVQFSTSIVGSISDGFWLHCASMLRSFCCCLHPLGVIFASIDFALFWERVCVFDDLGNLAENFLRKHNSSKKLSHDSLKADGVTPWHEERRDAGGAHFRNHWKSAYRSGFIDIGQNHVAVAAARSSVAHSRCINSKVCLADVHKTRAMLTFPVTLEAKPK